MLDSDLDSMNPDLKTLAEDVKQCCGSGTGSGWIQNLDGSGTDINVSDLDPDSNPDSDQNQNPDPKKICKKKPFFQAVIRWFHMIIHISHLQVVAAIAVQ
jgi:hypothetical protein